MSSDVNGLRRADRLMGGGALALLIVLFLVKWYEASVQLGTAGGLRIFGGSFTGWHAFTHSRWIWLLTGVAALAAVAMTLNQSELDLGVRRGTIVALLGALSSVTILYRIIHHPIAPAGEATAGAHLNYSSSTEIGIWIALAAALVITYGGYLAMHSEGPAPSRDPDEHEPHAGRDPQDAVTEKPASQAFSGLVVQGASRARDRTAATPSAGAPVAEPTTTQEPEAKQPEAAQAPQPAVPPDAGAPTAPLPPSTPPPATPPQADPPAAPHPRHDSDS